MEVKAYVFIMEVNIDKLVVEVNTLVVEAGAHPLVMEVSIDLLVMEVNAPTLNAYVFVMKVSAPTLNAYVFVMEVNIDALVAEVRADMLVEVRSPTGLSHRVSSYSALFYCIPVLGLRYYSYFILPTSPN